MTLTAMISQPVWILVSLIGVADILILAWCITLIRRNRHKHEAACRNEFAVLPEQPLPSGQFRQDLACLQIDAVFDGLAALIETERIKLKSMIQPLSAPVRPESATLQKARENTRESKEAGSRSPIQSPSLESQELPLDQEIARIAASGLKPAAIANRLGISLAEVDLALRMRTGDRTPAGCKLEAVA